MKRYSERQAAIVTLYNYEEANGIPKGKRLTYNQYENHPAIPSQPSKKPYGDIRDIENRVKDLRCQGKL